MVGDDGTFMGYDNALQYVRYDTVQRKYLFIVL